ncbi:hypothetical protein Hypma_002733 [Hypsizygus marmoreus]|uniref:Uncharacterized protein n=1 Tax=Hypsizygus marmoreus TaxID=39966 RepID=A0A369J2V1_HYPMA|nr:hypothetical protein Hypma_002733 [Hypsizygus marmoreus]
MFDVNTPETMAALTKCWAEFREKAPSADDDVREICCVLVGNKVNLIVSGTGGEEGPVRENEVRQVLQDLYLLHGGNNVTTPALCQHHVSKLLKPVAGAANPVQFYCNYAQSMECIITLSIIPFSRASPLQFRFPVLITFLRRLYEYNTHDASNIPHTFLLPLRRLPLRTQLPQAIIYLLLTKRSL